MATVFEFSGSVPPGTTSDSFALTGGTTYTLAESAAGASCDWYLYDSDTQQQVAGPFAEGQTTQYTPAVDQNVYLVVDPYMDGGPFRITVDTNSLVGSWVNAFDMGQWDVYVHYTGITTDPVPDSYNNFVKIEDLDPRVGTVSVINGEIVCDLESADTLGFSVIIMPKGTPPSSTFARLTVTDEFGSPLSAPLAEFWSVEQMELINTPPSYTPISGSMYTNISAGTLQDVVSSTEVPFGDGLSVYLASGG